MDDSTGKYGQMGAKNRIINQYDSMESGTSGMC